MKILKTLLFPLLLILAIPTFSQEGFLIIAPDEFIDELEVLKNYKQCSGRAVHLMDLTTIDNVYIGDDLPEKIKRCILDFEQYNNVWYVMLVGDSDKFPVRYIRAYNTEWGSKYYPSDLYYSDLYNSSYTFDDWDGDNDGIIGEMDFSGGTNINLVNLDNINMFPDIAVARVPVSSESELITYINKIIDYELRAPGNWFNNVVLAVDGHVSPFGDTTKTNQDVIPNIAVSGFNFYKRYMDDPLWTGLSYTDRATEMSTRLNNGVGFVNYHGHGNRHSWSNLIENGWFDRLKIPALTNDHMLPIMFASSCYTGRFHPVKDYYMDINGNEWNILGQPPAVLNYPEPMAIQPSIYDSYDNESLAEEFLVKNSGGAIGYIGVTSKSEHGMWLSDPATSIGLAPYFFEDYCVNSNRALGIVWKHAVLKFAIDVASIGMSYFAFLHLHKTQLFGDPSLTIGGRYTNELSGEVFDGWYGPWYSYMNGRIDGDVYVPSGQTLTVNEGGSFLFNDGRKIIGLGSNPGDGLVVNGTTYAPVCFFSLSPEPQSNYFLHGMKIYGTIKAKNGGEIKFY